jgi:hypothetical protein
MEGVREAGRVGEGAAGIIKSTERIPSASGSAAYRIPDELGDGVLGEVKNVAELGYTNQLRDFAADARASDGGLEFRLYLRESTKLVGPLADDVANGLIRRIDILP